MTPTERLRAAADSIERTANAAPSGPWRVGGRYDDEVLSDTAPASTSERELYGAAVVGESMRGGAPHVALWDPPTALLAAETLRAIADVVDQFGMIPPAAERLADRVLTGVEVPS